MGWTGQRQRWAVARGVLLAGVLTGLFGMHVLTAEDAANGHGAMPMIGVAPHGGSAGHDPSMAAAAVMGEPASGPSSAVDPATTAVAAGRDDTLAPVTAAVVGPADPGPGTGHAAMAACILFLAIGGAALLLAMLRHRGPLAAAGLGRLAAGWTDLRRRGPPIGWPRVSLSVIRV